MTVRGGGLIEGVKIMDDSDGNSYPVPLSHYSSEGRLLFLVCEASQLYPARVRQISVKRLKRKWDRKELVVGRERVRE